MHKIQNKKNIFNILKLLGAIIILYLGFTLNVLKIGENISFTQNIPENYLINNVESLDLEIQELIGKHNSSQKNIQEEIDTQEPDLDGEKNEYKMKYQRLCVSNMSLCSKIKFEGDYEYKQKYMYLASSMYILNNIQSNIQFGKSIKDQLKLITINNEVGTRRGYATWNEIVINLGTVPSYFEFFELLTHELGHIVDLGMVRGFNNKKSSVYTEFSKKVFEIDDPSLSYYAISWQSEKVRKSDSNKEDFCSGYGMSDPFEDFAECHNWYLNHNKLFKEIAKINQNMKLKYNFMANLYGGTYLFNSEDDLIKIKYNVGWRPWDTTRM